MKQCNIQLPNQTNNKRNDNTHTILSPIWYGCITMDDDQPKYTIECIILSSNLRMVIWWELWVFLYSDCMLCQSNKLVSSLQHHLWDLTQAVQTKICTAWWIYLVNSWVFEWLKHICADCSAILFLFIKVSNRSMRNWCSQELACSSERILALTCKMEFKKLTMRVKKDLYTLTSVMYVEDTAKPSTS